MAVLGYCFDKYYYSESEEEREQIKQQFLNTVWGILPYTVQKRTFKFKVIESVIPDEEMIEFFKQYSTMEYTILKSRYNINELEKEHLVKARINSNYGKYFDERVYLDKDYYRHIAHLKNIYFNYIDGKYETCEEVKAEVVKIHTKANELKQKSVENKIQLSWEEYQEFVNGCFDKIFKNYVPLEEKIYDDNFEWEDNTVIDWDEENFVVGYVNKSLNGYLKNYIKERNKPKEKFCEVCGCEIEVKSKNKYCRECAKKINREKTKQRMKLKRQKEKELKEKNKNV